MDTFTSLVDRCSPFKVGDRAELNYTPIIDPPSGWYPYRHALKLGAAGTVVGRDYSPARHEFIYLWEADDSDLWVRSGDDIVLVGDRRRCFMIRETDLRRTNAPRPERKVCQGPHPDPEKRQACQRPEGHQGPHAASYITWEESKP